MTPYQGNWCPAFDSNAEVSACQDSAVAYGKRFTFIASESAVGRIGSRTVVVTQALRRFSIVIGGVEWLVACEEVVHDSVRLEVGHNTSPSSKTPPSDRALRPIGPSTTVAGDESLAFDGLVSENTTVQTTLQLPSKLTLVALRRHRWYVINTLASQPRIQVPTDLNPGPMNTETLQINTLVTASA